MNRIVFSKLLLFLLLSIAALLVGTYQAQDNQPRNLRIVREDPGGDNDRLVARWSPPSTGVPSQYWYRVRRRRAGDDNWGRWPDDFSTTTATSVTIFRPSGIPEDKAVDVQIQVDAGTVPGPTATVYNVWEEPPGPRRKGPWPTATPRPPAKTCETLSNSDSGIQVSSSLGLDSGIQCQQLNAAGIGDSNIVADGFIDAVDVWGWVRHAEVCFRGRRGAFLFLDAATSPRTAIELQGYFSLDMACVEIDRPGSVVLIPSDEVVPERVATVVAEPETQMVTAPVANVVSRAIASTNNCWVWTRHIVNLRAAPVDGDVLARVPYDVSLQVVARTSGWFQVIWQGVHGWVSASLVRVAGPCS